MSPCHRKNQQMQNSAAVVPVAAGLRRKARGSTVSSQVLTVRLVYQHWQRKMVEEVLPTRRGSRDRAMSPCSLPWAGLAQLSAEAFCQELDRRCWIVEGLGRRHQSDRP